MLEVLHVDNHLLVVRKKAGILSQGDDTGDASLVDLARRWLIETYHKEGNAFVGLVHRLDRPVEGVMVLSRTSKGATRLNDQFRTRSVEKVYWAIVEGTPKKLSGQRKDVLDGKECTLSFDVRAKTTQRAWLEVRPLTGRKHQIRRQLAAMGHPIVGDVRYGASKPLSRHSIALLAHAITVEHPTTRERMTFCVEAPDWWPWAMDN